MTFWHIQFAVAKLFQSQMVLKVSSLWQKALIYYKYFEELLEQNFKMSIYLQLNQVRSIESVFLQIIPLELEVEHFSFKGNLKTETCTKLNQEHINIFY